MSRSGYVGCNLINDTDDGRNKVYGISGSAMKDDHFEFYYYQCVVLFVKMV